MVRKRLVTVLAAVLLTLVGTVIIVTYVSTAERRALEGQQRTTVLAANERIPANTAASDLVELVHPIDVPVDLRPEDAIATLDNVADQVTAADLLPNEPLRLGQFQAPDTGTARGGQDLPDEFQIVSVSLEPQRALGGRVQPDQLVGVIISMDRAEIVDPDAPGGTSTPDEATGMVLNRVRVTAVDGGVDPETGEAGGAVTVAFAVDEPDAERLVFGAEHGRIWLTEQNDNTPPIDPAFRTRRDILKDIDTGGQ